VYSTVLKKLLGNQYLFSQSPLRLTALVTWESTCTPGVALESSFPHCTGHRHPNHYFPSATAKLNRWSFPVHTPHLFQWQEAPTGIRSCARSEDCCLLPIRRMAKVILGHDGSGTHGTIWFGLKSGVSWNSRSVRPSRD
jgi:hypothetical protein